MKKIKIMFSIFSLGILILLSSCSLYGQVNIENSTTEEVPVEVIEEIKTIIEEDINEENLDEENNDSSSSLISNEIVDIEYVAEENDTPDFFTITNKIQTETIKANVRIEASFYSSSRGRYTLTASSIGSGVIIKQQTSRGKNYYYCLTNNHVVYSGNSYATYVIEDVYETEYNATLLYSLNTYDLALMRFESSTDLYVVELEDEDLTEGYVAAIGEANAKSNTLTYGYITGSEEFEPNESEIEESNVTFDVITHNAYIEPGSSGGALLDINLKLVGINFASRIDEESNWEYSYAIPLSKILEFLEICEAKVGFSL